MPCPLCNHAVTAPYWQDRRREYWQCRECRLVFVPAHYHLSAAAEKAEYDLHRNSPEDTGYRQFLNRLAEPLLTRLPPVSHGLDFGCGPGPTLSLLLAAAGHRVDLYDIYYAKDEAVWDREYQFITATEVVEHLARPGDVLNRLWQCLAINGVLGLMTKRVIDRERFANWHYKNDLTHISFFSQETFYWLSERWGASLEFIDKDVVLMSKRDCEGSDRAKNTKTA